MLAVSLAGFVGSADREHKPRRCGVCSIRALSVRTELGGFPWADGGCQEIWL
jgi:hypothetical protein